MLTLWVPAQIAERLRTSQREAKSVRLQRIGILVRELGNLVLRRPAFMQHRTPGFLAAYMKTVDFVMTSEEVRDEAEAQETLRKVQDAEELLLSVS